MIADMEDEGMNFRLITVADETKRGVSSEVYLTVFLLFSVRQAGQHHVIVESK